MTDTRVLCRRDGLFIAWHKRPFSTIKTLVELAHYGTVDSPLVWRLEISWGPGVRA